MTSKLLFLILLASLLLLSCSTSSQYYDIEEISPIQNISFDASAWFWKIPQGPYAIGIAWDDGMFGSGALEAAREYAAVSLSRNKGSFVVDKSMIVSLAAERTIDWQQAGYELVVSADTAFLHYANAHLVQVDSYAINGYLICLFYLPETNFGNAKPKVDSAIRPMQVLSFPSWCSDPELSTNDSNVYSVASSHQASLIDAIFFAQEKALKQLGRYRLQNVVSRVLATDSMLEKAIAMETVTQNKHTMIDQIFVYHIKIDNTPSYRAFIRLKGDL
ncbi:MAG: hypothetical protein U1C33_04430 [Candidatus Cloacimonadaceae bacterium]|nr:hypothetical protein [Candidatus Cloacimonadaceae bacterium]